jgi:hypothetical protein
MPHGHVAVRREFTLRTRSLTVTALAALLALLLVLPAGCGGRAGEAIAEITLTNVALQDAFALYYPVASSTTPRVPAYTVSPDLSNVAGASAARVSPEARRILGLQGFVAVAGESETIYGAYQDIEGAKLVTVEALLGTYHSMCTYALRGAEEGFLTGDLRGLVDALYAAVEGMYRGGGEAVREAAVAVLAYLGVAAGLLGIEVAVPPEVEDMVEAELVLISGHAGTAISPFSGYQEDYGRYGPYGHYADGGRLEGYFKAMKWLGGMGFYASPGAGSGDVAAGRDMTRQALLLVGALHAADVDGEPAYVVWDRIYQPASFLAGFSGGLNAYTYTRLMRELLDGGFPLGRLEEDALVDEFIARAVMESPAGFVPAAGVGGSGSGRSSAFRLFGLQDSAEDRIMQRLVSPEVPERFLPRGLDVPAALGSDRALQVLDQVYGENDLAGYAESMGELRELFTGADPAQIRSSAYWSCLDIMHLLLQPRGEGYPYFMRGDAWQDRALYGFMGSWARMRHDDILHAGEYAAEEQDSPGEAAMARGYVEPYPEAFARLAAVTDMTRRGLEERGLAQQPVLERLGELYELLLYLKTMAEKELRGETLDTEEYAVIDGIGYTLQRLLTFPLEGEGDEAFERSASPPFVDDIYAGGEYGEVLQVAAGRPVTYYVVVPVDGRPTLTAGAGYSYYEFVRPAGGRLDDETWLEMVESGQLPQTPAWTGSFLR